MKFLIELQIFSERVSILRVSAVSNMNALASIENSAQYILLISIKANSFSESACDDLAVELILKTIIQKYWAPFDLNKITDHLDKSWQVELNIMVEANVFGDEE